MIDITTNKLYIRDKQDEFQCLPGLEGAPGPENYFIITEDMVTVTTEDTYGVAPYSTSYYYTNITINDSSVKWVEGGLYYFVINTKMVVTSSYRNVRIRIGTSGDWKPLMGAGASILAGSSYFIKSENRMYMYKSTYQSGGALHLHSDNNTTYAYLVNQVATGTVTVATNGYGARYSLLFQTTPISAANQRWSSLVLSSGTGTTKTVPTSLTFYADRHPIYNYSANITADSANAAAMYQYYAGMDLRYTCNTSSTYCTALNRVFMFLKDFNTNDYSFKADATVGNIVTKDKLATRFPSSTQGSVYLYYLGWTTSNWYGLNVDIQEGSKIWRYTPSTGELVIWGSSSNNTACYDFSDYENDLPAGTFNKIRADFDAGKIVFVKWPIPDAGGYTPQLPEDSWVKLAYHNYSDSSNRYFYSEHFLVPNADGDLYQYYFCLDDKDYIDWYPADYNAPILTENSGVKKSWDTSDSGKILGINSSGVVSPVRGGLAAHIIDLTGLTAWGPIPSSTGVTLAGIKSKVDTGIPTYIKLDLSNKSLNNWVYNDVVYLKIVAAASNNFVTEPLITEPSYSSSQNDSCFVRFIGYVSGSSEMVVPQSMFTVPYSATCPSSFTPSVVLNAAQVNDGFVPKTFNTSYSGKLLGIGSNGKVSPVDPPATGVTDVKVNDASVVTSGVATIPIGTTNNLGVIQPAYGANTYTNGKLYAGTYAADVTANDAYSSYFASLGSVKNYAVPKVQSASDVGKVLTINASGEVVPLTVATDDKYYDLGSGSSITQTQYDNIVADFTAGKNVFVKWSHTNIDTEYRKLWVRVKTATSADGIYTEDFVYTSSAVKYIGYYKVTSGRSISYYTTIKFSTSASTSTSDVLTANVINSNYVAINQGTSQSGKMLGVGSDGKVTTVTGAKDVQINSTSILSNGVANIPYASTGTAGVVKLGTNGGLKIDSNSLYTDYATTNSIKEGTDAFRPITPTNNYVATFYGLAKAAGDNTQASSSNPTGIYTDTAKQKIQELLGVVATNQGVASAGKILGINSSGIVEAIDAPTGGSLPIAEEAIF